VPGDPRIRASDADRDRTAALLREHHAAGRLTAEEFDERLDQALNAKTLGELDELLSDLPVIDLYKLPHESMQRPAGLPHTSIRPRNPGGGTTARFGRGMGAWAVVTGTVIAIWVVTAAVGLAPWMWIPWGLLVAVASWTWLMTRRYRRRRE
jgi:Flp pilus assembly protein TadB